MIFVFVRGRHYFSRSGVKKEIKPCARCGRTTCHETFEGSRWDYVNFVPLVPRGRKQVLDRCTGCGDLFEFEPSAWQADKAAALALVQEHFGRDKSRVDYAVEALFFHTRYDTLDGARAVAEAIEQSFSNEPVARARLVAWFAGHGQLDRAVRLVSAITSHDEVRDSLLRTIGNAAIVAGNHQLAKDLLLQISTPVESPDLRSLLTVAMALRSSGRDRDTYEVLTYLFRHFPKRAAGHSQAVSMVAKLERKQRIHHSILPAGARSRKDLYILTGFAAVGIIGGLVANHLVSLLQPLYVINATQARAVVEVDAAKPTAIKPGGELQLTVAEGQHVVRVRLDNGYAHETTVEIRNNLIDRFRFDNAFVYDILGAEAYAVDEIVYSNFGGTAADASNRLLAGSEFYSFHDVSYAFTDPPESLSSKSGHEVRTLLYRVPGLPQNIAHRALQSPRVLKEFKVRNFLEGQLLGGNTDPALVTAYLDYCLQAKCDVEAARLLASLKLGVPEQQKPNAAQ